MSLRTFLRQWLRGLRPTTATPTAVSAYSHLRQLHSLEALMLLPTVTPDRSEYVRNGADLETVNDVVTWLFFDLSDDWWESPGTKYATRRCAGWRCARS